MAPPLPLRRPPATAAARVGLWVARESSCAVVTADGMGSTWQGCAELPQVPSSPSAGRLRWLCFRRNPRCGCCAMRASDAPCGPASDSSPLPARPHVPGSRRPGLAAPTSSTSVGAASLAELPGVSRCSPPLSACQLHWARAGPGGGRSGSRVRSARGPSTSSWPSHGR